MVRYRCASGLRRHMDIDQWVDRGDRVFVDELGLVIARERHPELVKVGDIALEFDAAYEEDRDGHAPVSNMPQERVLKACGRFLGHRASSCGTSLPLFCELRRDRENRTEPRAALHGLA
jgi:hypothetical protein